MLDGRLLIDAHVHPPRLPTLKAAWMSWAEQFGSPGWRSVFDRDGVVIAPPSGITASRHGASQHSPPRLYLVISLNRYEIRAGNWLFSGGRKKNDLGP